MRKHRYQAWHRTQQKMYRVENMLFGENGVRLLYLTLPDGSRSMTTDKLDDIDLREYIGIEDRHGKEIYEGDYLKLRLGNDTLEVRWSVFGFRFFNVRQNEWQMVWGADLKRLEVIGNIYELPIIAADF